MNISGGKPKLANFNHFLSNTSYDVITIQETWFDESVKDGEITGNSNFNIIRRDRSATTNKRLRGGGVMTLISKDITYQQIEFNYETLLEYTVCKIGTDPSTLMVINVYIPPYDEKSRLSMIIQLNSIVMSVIESFKNVPV